MRIVLSRKITFKGILSNISFIGIILALLSLRINNFWPYSLVFIALFIPFTLSIRGVEIDYTSLCIKDFLLIYFIRIGKWQNINKFNQIILKQFSESQVMNMLSISRSYSAKGFEIILSNEKKETFIIAEFSSYFKARKLFDKINSNIDLEAKDLYEPVINQILSNQKK